MRMATNVANESWKDKSLTWNKNPLEIQPCEVFIYFCQKVES